MKTLKYTWWKKTIKPVEVKLHIDEDKEEYWIEVNGCQETKKLKVPNWGNGVCKWWEI